MKKSLIKALAEALSEASGIDLDEAEYIADRFLLNMQITRNLTIDDVHAIVDFLLYLTTKDEYFVTDNEFLLELRKKFVKKEIKIISPKEAVEKFKDDKNLKRIYETMYNKSKTEFFSAG